MKQADLKDIEFVSLFFVVDIEVSLFFFFCFSLMLLGRELHRNIFILHNYCTVKYYIAGAPFDR